MKKNYWKRAERIGQIDVRRYVPGEDLSHVSVSPEDTPQEGGWIARNPNNQKDQWYINAEYFEKNYSLKQPY